MNEELNTEEIKETEMTDLEKLEKRIEVLEAALPPGVLETARDKVGQ